MPSPEFPTLVDLLQYRAAHQPNQIAYTFLQDGEIESGSLSYRELDQQAQSIAAYLGQLAHPGDRTLLLYPSGLDFITAFMGCLYAGVLAIPAYPPRRNQMLSRLDAIINDAQPSVVLTTTSILATLQPQWSEHPLLSPRQWARETVWRKVTGVNLSKPSRYFRRIWRIRGRVPFYAPAI